MKTNTSPVSRLKKFFTKKGVIVSVIIVALTLNLITFVLAYPEMFKPSSSTLARDFSAYYMGGWRLFHNPTKIYAGGSQPGDYQILPKPQTFKYAPSFFILISPFLVLSYQDAFIAFNIVQLVSMLVLAFFVYKLVKDKNLILAAVACFVVLIAPLPSFSSRIFSWSYYWGWVCGNAHVIQPVFLLGAMYFGTVKKPWLSALLFSFGVFDPRFALMAFPLIVWYNRRSIFAFVAGTAVFLCATNLPFFLYQGVGFAFLSATVSGRIVSQMYAYDWIPFYSILALTLVELFTVLSKKVKGAKAKPNALLD
jgi:hypothetical protein